MAQGRRSTSSTETGASPRPRVSIPEGHLLVGAIGRPHGVRGEMHAELLSENEDRFAAGSRLTLSLASRDPGAGQLSDSGSIEVEIVRSRPHAGHWLIQVEGFSTREEAESVRGGLLSVPADDAVPIPGQVWLRDLIGLSAETAEGTCLGKVVDVLDYPAQDLLVVETGRGRVLLPNVPELVPDIDLAAGKLTVDPPDGMFPAGVGESAADREPKVDGAE